MLTGESKVLHSLASYTEAILQRGVVFGPQDIWQGQESVPIRVAGGGLLVTFSGRGQVWW